MMQVASLFQPFMRNIPWGQGIDGAHIRQNRPVVLLAKGQAQPGLQGRIGSHVASIHPAALQSAYDQPTKTVIAHFSDDAGSQPQPGCLAGKDTARPAHLQRVVADQAHEMARSVVVDRTNRLMALGAARGLVGVALGDGGHDLLDAAAAVPFVYFQF